MIGMQYNIQLPADYDMTIIHKRIENSGYKTDGFKDLVFKAYLISEKDQKGASNSYRPFYVWEKTDGMNQFLFNGSFDNILSSFGWQKVEIGVTQKIERGTDFLKSRFVTIQSYEILETASLNNFDFEDKNLEIRTGKVVLYNPEKWRYEIFTFYKEKPKMTKGKLLKLMYLSKGEKY